MRTSRAIDRLRLLTQEQYHEHYSIIRRIEGIQDTGCDLSGKQEMINAIRQYEQDGKVLVCSRFMDCDHATSTCSSLVSANFYVVTRVMDEIYEHAEGPGSCWLEKPDNKPDSNPRDLMLEAYEDGHPHSVSEVRYESH
jgi:hypothetical protein